MVTRQASYADLAKIAKVLKDEDFIVNWMLKVRKFPGLQALVTIENKEVKYAMFNELDEAGTIVNLFLFSRDDMESKEIDYLIKRSKEYYEEKGMKPLRISTTVGSAIFPIFENIGFQANAISCTKQLGDENSNVVTKESQESS